MANTPHVEPLLREGQTFVGKYLIGKEVGRGGYGAVYLADDLALKRKVAIKVLHPKHATDKKTLKRFQREVWASTRLSHPSIVAVHDTGKAPDGTLYIVMEFVDGDVLQARLKSIHVRNLRIGHTKMLQVGLQVARALAAAHDKGIFHRDLKPHNLMLVSDDDAPGGERVKILDFGIAKLAPEALGAEEDDEGATSTGDQLPGTGAYMAPEQFGTYQGSTGLEGRMDVYSLGVILYLMVAGRLPLYDENPITMMGMALARDPEPLMKVDPSLAAPTADLIHKMLTKEAKDRLSMAQVRDRIAFLLGLSGGSRVDLVTVRPTAEHEALLAAKLNTGDLEAELAGTADPPPSPKPMPATHSVAQATPSTKDLQSVGDRSTEPQEANLSSARATGQQVTGPGTLARRRGNQAMAAAVIAAATVGIGGSVLVWRMPSGPRPMKTAQVAAAPAPPPASTVAAPPEADAPASRPALEPATPAAASAPKAEEADSPRKTKKCIPARVTSACLSGSPLSGPQQQQLLAAVEQAKITLCPSDKIVVAASPKAEIRKSDGVKRARLEDLTLALRGSRLAWLGDVIIQCKRDP